MTQSKTFTLDYDILMGEHEEHLNNKIVADRQLLFSYLDINSVFESLEFEELLEYHANDIIHMLKTSKIVQGITGLVLFLIVFIITFTVVWCCRRKCDRCFCAQLKWWQILFCFCCGTKQRPRHCFQRIILSFGYKCPIYRRNMGFITKIDSI